MGTMLMTRSTPRITYKMGTRAGLGAVLDKSLPWLGSGAPSIEVAADFTGIYRILMGESCWEGKTVSFAITKVPVRTGVWRGFGNETHGRPADGAALSLERFALAGAGHQFINCFARGFAFMQDEVHLLSDGHLDAASPRQPDRRRGRKDSFGDHAMHSGQNLGQLSSVAKLDAHASIAGEAAGAGQHQVPQAC